MSWPPEGEKETFLGQLGGEEVLSGLGLENIRRLVLDVRPAQCSWNVEVCGWG